MAGKGFERNRKQLANKPVKMARMMKFSKAKERKTGADIKKCRKCGKTSGVTSKYGLMYCRQCFREEAEKLGFRKYS
jgi:small subunit ribosomal protein S14